jgi:ribosome modulation factor
MKRIALLAIALSGLSGCTAMTGSMRETLVTSESGVKTYLLTNDISRIWGKAYAIKGLNGRSKELCPNGYTVMNEETRNVKNWTGNDAGREEVTRKIMCDSTE